MVVDVLQPYPCRSTEFPDKTKKYASNSDGPVPWISKSFRFEIKRIRVHLEFGSINTGEKLARQVRRECSQLAGCLFGWLACALNDQEAISHCEGIVSSGDLASFLDAIPCGSRNLLDSRVQYFVTDNRNKVPRRCFSVRDLCELIRRKFVWPLHEVPGIPTIEE